METTRALLVCAPMILLDRRDAGSVHELLARMHGLCSKKKLRHEAIRRFIEGEHGTDGGEAPEKDPKKALVHRVARLAGLGAERKALEALRPDVQQEKKTAKQTDVEKLRAKFPDVKKVAPQLPPPSADAARGTGEDLVRAIVSQLPPGSAPGRDGWTQELLKPIAKRKSDPAVGVTRAIGALVDSITHDTTDKELKLFMRHAVLVPVAKPDASFRPVVLTSVLVKLAWKIAIGNENVRAAIHPAARLGALPCQAAVIRAQRAVDEGHTLACLDAKNAFGEISRATIANAVARFEGLRGLFNFWYDTSVDPIKAVWWGNGGAVTTINIPEGLLQGCCGSPLLFHLGLSSLLSKGHWDHVAITAVADDVSITGEIPHVLTGIRSVHRVLEEGGIPLNVTKTQMVCDQKDVDTAKRAGFSPVERADLLGGVVAAKHVKTIELKDTRARYRQYAEGLNRSVKDLPAQTANILLRHLVRMVGYVLSTCDTKRVTQWCADMTKLQTDCFEKIMGVKLADRARRQICLRDEDGGNELVDWTEVQKVAHAALIQVTLDKELKAQPSLVKYKIEEHRKAAGKAFWESRRGVDIFFPRAQRRVYAECRYQFNNIKPETDDLVLGDMQFKTMMAVRLGMQETSFIPSVCPTEKERNEQCSTVDHALACRMCAGHYHTQRHERISHAIVRTLRTADVEPGSRETPRTPRQLGVRPGRVCVQRSGRSPRDRRLGRAPERRETGLRSAQARLREGEQVHRHGRAHGLEIRATRVHVDRPPDRASAEDAGEDVLRGA